MLKTRSIVTTSPDELVCFSWWLLQACKVTSQQLVPIEPPIGCCESEIIAKCLSCTVEWFGITVATFTANFWLTMYYGMCSKSCENQLSWIFKVRYIKANDLVHIATDMAWYKQQLVKMVFLKISKVQTMQVFAQTVANLSCAVKLYSYYSPKEAITVSVCVNSTHHHNRSFIGK